MCRSCRNRYDRTRREETPLMFVRRGREQFRREAIMAFAKLHGYITIEQAQRIVSQIE